MYPLPVVPPEPEVPDFEGLSEIWFPPLTASEYDQEFTGSSIPTNWNRNYTASSEPINPMDQFTLDSEDPREDFNEKRSWYRIQSCAFGAGTLPRGIHMQVSGGLPDGTYWARLGVARSYNFPDFELSVPFDGGMAMWLVATTGSTEPDFSEGVAIYPLGSPGTAHKVEAFSYSTGSRSDFGQASLADLRVGWMEYVAMIKSGSEFTAYAGAKGSGQWTKLGTLSHPFVDRVFLGVLVGSTGEVGNSVGAADFFRYIPTGSGGTFKLP